MESRLAMQSIPGALNVCYDNSDFSGRSSLTLEVNGRTNLKNHTLMTKPVKQCLERLPVEGWRVSLGLTAKHHLSAILPRLKGKDHTAGLFGEHRPQQDSASWVENQHKYISFHVLTRLCTVGTMNFVFHPPLSEPPRSSRHRVDGDSEVIVSSKCGCCALAEKDPHNSALLVSPLRRQVPLAAGVPSFYLRVRVVARSSALHSPGSPARSRRGHHVGPSRPAVAVNLRRTINPQLWLPTRRSQTALLNTELSLDLYPVTVAVASCCHLNYTPVNSCVPGVFGTFVTLSQNLSGKGLKPASVVEDRI
ncbi:hypothetical protein EYF80_002062 [Liparis tanakae]|uniref:Uncharacterized protein n=1 Tax=Liparis tanakae TaxID=230148 RepID=A0A4Z2JBL8_9TELE|nr:hypothetical protein EYF80_002062 [Liparis tanakae]